MRSFENNDVADGRRGVDGLIRDGFHTDVLASSPETIGGDECDSVRVGETRGDRIGAVARKERQDDAAQLDHSEEGRNQLGTHRHEQRNAVTLGDPDLAQGVRAAICQAKQLSVG